MKKIVLPLIGIAMSLGILQAQTDTMYIMKSGIVLGKFKTTEIDSIIFYNPTTAGLTVADIDGNVYSTVTIGTQTWMAENLRTTHYPDGTPIPRIIDIAGWDSLKVTSQAYCWYDDDSTKNAGMYGALYTWAGAMMGTASTTADPSGIQGVCPAGWHLPSNAEWSTMVIYLIENGYNYDGTTTGNKIGKSVAAASHWNSSSGVGAVGNTDYPTYRNKSGFTALPGGYRDQWGTFYFMGADGYWWSATEYSTLAGEVRSLFYYTSDFIQLPPSCYYKENGFSVRCVRD